MTKALFIYTFSILSFSNCKDGTTPKPQQQDFVSETAVTTIAVSKTYVAKTVNFISQQHYNKAICFFINLSLPSGKKRFFAYDLKGDSVLISGLVAHGSCNTSFLKNVVYSNTINSGCSSMGKYKIGYKYQGRFGASYKLYGLDSSNSNAFERAIVLHKYDCIPDNEMLDAAICNSLGCPMVSAKFFDQLSSIIDHSEKPLLLWIY